MSLLAGFRKRSRLIGRAAFDQVNIEFHGVRLGAPDWGWDSHALAAHLHAEGSGHLYLIAKSWREALEFELPPLDGSVWSRLVDTTFKTPLDIAEGDPFPLSGQRSYMAGARSIVVLTAT